MVESGFTGAMRARTAGLLLFFALCVLVAGRNVNVVNPTSKPVPIKVVGAAVATPTATATATGTPALVDGDPVSSWADSSGAGHTATQTGSARPTFKTAILNGKPVVRFTSAGLSGLNLATSISGAGNLCVFAVMKATGPTVKLVGLIGATAGGLFMPLELDNGNTYICDRLAVYTPTVVVDLTTAFHVITGQTTTTPTGAIYVDGGANLVATAGGAAVNSNDFVAIGYRAVDSLYSNGDIAELVIYNGAVGLTDQRNIEKYLGTKYGITVAGGTAVSPDTVTGLVGWWKADSLGP
jgi:hypothetical protein